MGAHRTPDIAVLLGYSGVCGKLFHMCGYRHHAGHAGRLGAGQNTVQVVGQSLEIEVAMAVDQHGYSALRSRRANTPCGDGRGVSANRLLALSAAFSNRWSSGTASWSSRRDADSGTKASMGMARRRTVSAVT